MAFPVGEHWRLLPAVRYRALSRDIEVGSSNTAVDLNYLSVGVGVVSRFF